MAQLLYPRHSSTLMEKTVKRHIRLLRQSKGTTEFADAIEPYLTLMVGKREATEQAEDFYQSKYDEMLFCDAGLDDLIRDLVEACRKYDRNHPGEITEKNLFPKGLSAVIYAPVRSEPGEVENLILRIAELGEGHELGTHVEPMQTAVATCKAAIKDVTEAIEAVKAAEALESIAKMNLARQYEQNLYALSSKFRKTYANRFFPRISVSSKANLEETES